MKVSVNEIQSQTRKAFLGLGFSDGDAQDAADMVTWAETYGLHGLEAVSRGLEFLRIEADAMAPDLIYEDGDISILDARGHSVLGSVSLAVELGYVRARAKGLSVTKIRRCHNRILVLGYLSRLARRGVNITAFWRNAHDPLTELVVGFQAGQSLPELCTYTVEEAPEETMRNDGITLVMANHVDLLPQLRSGFSLLDLRVRRPADFSQCRDTALQEGMAVSDELWRQLRSLANRTLVADSAAARTNAGAGTNDND